MGSWSIFIFCLDATFRGWGAEDILQKYTGRDTNQMYSFCVYVVRKYG